MNHVAPERLPGLIGHELRNPLGSAVARAMLAREMVDGDDPRAPVLDGVLSDLERVSKLLDGWLLLGRSSQLRLQRIVVDELVAVVCSRHGVEFVRRGGGAQVMGDRLLLERGLENLFENARQAGAGNVRIAVQALGNELSIHVEDDGSGVPREDLDSIFTAGWSSRGSAGLGLYAVATTIAAHAGRVRCIPLARGTRFTITLPLVSLVADETSQGAQGSDGSSTALA